MDKNLSHMNENGDIRMVNVGGKDNTTRTAIAKAEVLMKLETLKAIAAGDLVKGNLFSTAKVAGIMAAKRTSELIPLCHPLPINHISIELQPQLNLPGIEITAAVETISKTGVEMEALTAVGITALTIYDMAKSIDKTMCIQNMRLVEKQGGKSGHFTNE